MKDHTPIPRPNLFTVGDQAAWEEQFHMLCYVLGMSADQVAQIDHGFEPGAAEGWLATAWAREIEQRHPFVDVMPLIAGRLAP